MRWELKISSMTEVSFGRIKHEILDVWVMWMYFLGVSDALLYKQHVIHKAGNTVIVMLWICHGREKLEDGAPQGFFSHQK